MGPVHALLLTDIVDSTRLAETLGEAELGAAHDRVARDLLHRWGGREIDKTDGMLMLFDDVADAVGCALAYHRALGALPVPLRARAGVHVGAVTLRANPPDDVARGAKPLEVEGLAKPTAARVMSLALGGQTLLSAEARTALGGCAWRVQAHGHWRVKGVAEPIELFEVGDDGAPFTPPPDSAKVYRVVRRGELWLPLREIAHGLPAERDGFVGRRDALAELARRFERGARLVSVLGIGGTGKTRLAIRYGWTWLGDFPGGVWFCDLVPARDADGVVRAVAQALDLPLGADDPRARVGRAIAGRGPCLVILDNFEQVARHAAATLGAWLDRAPQACFLVTTREVLGLPGEEALALPPLAADDGEALFLRRAAAAHAGFEPGAGDRAAIGKLVALLDGLPLAIELAAARVRVMAPATLLARMDQRFRLLVAAGGRHDRQATLRAAIDWSWDLLSEAERSALAQLSTFEGGFTLDAAEAVLDLPDGADAPWAVDVVQSLVDKSLVRRAGDTRFELLVSVQEYAAERLRAMPGAARDDLLVRHATYYAALPGAAGEAAAWADIGNILVACRRSTGAGSVERAVAALESAWLLLQTRGPFAPAIELGSALAASPAPADDALRVRTELVLGEALKAAGRVGEAAAQLEAGLRRARAVGAAAVEARLLIALGNLELNDGAVARATERHAAALAIARALGDPALQCGALSGLATDHQAAGNLRAARADLEQAIGVAREARHRRWEGGLLGNLGGLLWDIGELDGALQHIRQSLQIARECGDRVWEGNALCNLGALHQAQGRLDEADAELEAALQAARALGHARLECIVRCNLGLVNLSLGRHERSRQHHEAALALARQLQDRPSEGQFLGYLGQLHAQCGDIAAARDCIAQAQAVLASLDDPFKLGLLLCQQAEVERLGGDPIAAQAAIERARRIYADIGAGPESEIGLALARLDADG